MLLSVGSDVRMNSSAPSSASNHSELSRVEMECRGLVGDPLSRIRNRGELERVGAEFKEDSSTFSKALC